MANTVVGWGGGVTLCISSLLRRWLGKQRVELQRGEGAVVRVLGPRAGVGRLFAEGHGHFLKGWRGGRAASEARERPGGGQQRGYVVVYYLCGEVVHSRMQVASLDDGDNVTHSVGDGDVAVPLAELLREHLVGVEGRVKGEQARVRVTPPSGSRTRL